MSPEVNFITSLDQQGFAIVPQVVPAALVAEFITFFDQPESTIGVRERNDRVYAMRNLLRLPPVRELTDSPYLRVLVNPVLGESARPVRGILFDKTPGANWKVAWHQDLSIAVKQRLEITGFGPWSIKAGVIHVQPRARVLKNMLTIRLHLDACGLHNGPLKVVPGSHGAGVLSPRDIERWRRDVPPVECVCPAGGAVIMRPLILHASSPATELGHRRVIHIEYAAGDLPGGLQWFEN